jgi:hypothetical protein
MQVSFGFAAQWYRCTRLRRDVDAVGSRSELATASPSIGGPDWQYHVTLNSFNGSAHMFVPRWLIVR